MDQTLLNIYEERIPVQNSQQLEAYGGFLKKLTVRNRSINSPSLIWTDI